MDEPGTDFQFIRGLGLPGMVLVRAFAFPEQVSASLGANEHVAYFALDAAVGTTQVPNDPKFDELHGLENDGEPIGAADADIDAPEAWNITTGSHDIVVGVIDTGVDYTHPDLAANIWTNPGEIPGNHKDDDGNGFVDDVHGYDFVDNDGDPMDDHGHGTHVAGTIAAVGNNSIGVTGVNWTSSILALKFLDKNNQGFTSDAVRAVNYATQLRSQHGIEVRVLNASWGAKVFHPSLLEAIQASQRADMLFVAAAGNGNLLEYGEDNDTTPFYPASYDVENVVSVAATGPSDELARFSNYGAASVDLAAPGVGILSTHYAGAYLSRNGTSMAAPHVSGVAALVWANVPYATAEEVHAAILAGVDAIPSLDGKTVTGGRLNAYRSLIVDTVAPRAVVANAMDVKTEGGASYQFSIDYSDNVSVKIASLGNGDVAISRHDGGGTPHEILANLINVDIASNGTPRRATYEITPPGGEWDSSDNGQYQILLQPDEVFDTNDNVASPKTLGAFQVDIPVALPIDVNSTLDTVDADPNDGVAVDAAGKTTLRAAVMEANARSGVDTIRLPVGTYRFTLAGAGENSAATGDLDILEELTIEGAGVDATVIDANQLDRVFEVSSNVRLTLSNLSLKFGAADSGGVIRSEGDLELQRVKVSDGRAVHPGGAGGGIWSSGSLKAVDTTIANNQATAGGGGVHIASGTAELLSSTLSENQTQASGGGLYHGGSLLKLTNSTISGNRATASAGGGIYIASGALALTNVTVTGNEAAEAAGVAATGGTTSVANTIIAANTSTTGGDIQGNFTSQGNNLIGDVGQATGFSNGVKGDQVGSAGGKIDPQLESLADNGGLTKTHALKRNSPAIDAGNDMSAAATDQRGQGRPEDGDDDGQGVSDIGAFEFVLYTEIHGLKFHDLNENGVRDAGEPGLAGWTVYLDTNNNGTLDTGERGTKTVADNPATADVNEGGGYSFTGLLPGDYVIREVQQAAWTETAPTPAPAPIVLTLSIDDVIQAETDSGTTDFQFTVALSGPSDQTVTVDYATEAGTSEENSDYVATSGTLTFAPQEITKTITVVVNGDTEQEPHEYFIVALSNSANAEILDEEGEGTILTDDITYEVNSTADKADINPGNGVVDTGTPGEITLRAAVMEANATAGQQTILLGPETYTLSIPGSGEDTGAKGDLDILGQLILVGSGSNLTTIDAQQLDRAIDATDGVPQLHIAGLKVTGGFVSEAEQGAGIRWNSHGGLFLNDVCLTANTSVGKGGGIYALGPLNVHRAEIRSNTAQHGGGIYADSGVELVRTSLSKNQASGDGGGLYVGMVNMAPFPDAYLINLTTISDNTASQDGGGIYIPVATFPFGGPSPPPPYLFLSVWYSTLANNSADQSGGGASIGVNAGATFGASTLSGNQATNAGGAISNAGMSALYFSTVYDNSAATGGGVFASSGGQVYLDRAIVASNTTDLAGNGLFVSYDYNLVGNGSGIEFAQSGPHDQIGSIENPIDPALTPLGDYGGATPVHSLNADSPAIDVLAQEDRSNAAMDQRGRPRPADGNDDGIAWFDIGAFERQPSELAVTAASPSYEVTLTPGQIATSYDFGNRAALGEIRGRKFRDANGNGAQDTGEPGLAGWTIYLDQDRNGTLDDSETSTVTDANGDFAFTDLEPLIEYHVAEVAREGWIQSAPQRVFDLNLDSRLTSGDKTSVVLTGDWNGDGNMDLAFARASGAASIALNDGTGKFGDPIQVSDGLTVAMAAGDWDRDGDTDLAVSDNVDNKISILKNDGQGIFSTSANLTVGVSPGALAVGDVDGDGDADILSANQSGNPTALFVNDGDGDFATAIFLGDGGDSRSVQIGDLDGDEDLDVVIANHAASITIIPNAGNGTFSTPQTVNASTTVDHLVLADLDGDGDLDLAASGSSVVLLRNNGDATFEAAVTLVDSSESPRELEATDWDGDNDIDLVVACESSDQGRVAILQNYGPGVFASPVFTDILSSRESFALAAFDANGDGSQDLAVANQGGSDGSTHIVGDVSILLSSMGLHAHVVPLQPGSTVTDVQFGNRPLPGTIQGHKFKDLDGDGVWDEGEPGLSGWKIFLDENKNGILNTGEQTTVTDADGFYEFTDLEPLKTYHVAEVVQVGWEQKSPVRPQGNVAVWQVSADADFMTLNDLAVNEAGKFVLSGLDGQGSGFNSQAIFHLEDPTGNAAVLAAAASPDGIAFNGDHVFWIDAPGDIDGTAILRYSWEDDSVDKLFSGQDANQQIVHGTGLDFVPQPGSTGTLVVADSVGGGIYRMQATSPVTNLAQLGGDRYSGFFDRAHPTHLDVYNGLVYIADAGISGFGDTPPRIQSIPLTGGTFTDLHIGNIASFSPQGIVVHEDTIYLTNDDKILQMPTTGGQPSVLASDPRWGKLKGIEYYDGSLYVVDNGDGNGAVVWQVILDQTPIVSNEGAWIVELDAGQTAAERDFGNFESTTGGQSQFGQIAGTLFDDLNGDGAQTSGEDGLAGWTVYLDLNRNGRHDFGEPKTQTTAGGGYQLNGIPEGKYSLDFLQPLGRERTAPKTLSFSKAEFKADQGAKAMAFGDFDRDGDQDLFVANSLTNDVTVFTNDGLGEFQSGDVYQVGFGPNAIVAAQLNDDNGDSRIDANDYLDLAVANSLSSDVSILRGTSLGTFQPQTKYPVGTGPNSLAALDFDSDNDIDLAVTLEFANEVVILLNENGNFTRHGSVKVGDAPMAIVGEDFNADGHADLAVANFMSNSVTILSNRGIDQATWLGFQTTGPFEAGGNPYALTAAHMNGDSHIDLAVANVLSDTVSLLVGDGNGAFNLLDHKLDAGRGPTSLAAGDLNGDGYTDLAVANARSSNVSVLLHAGNSQAEFQAPVNFGVANFPISLSFSSITADFDQDQDLDIAVVNSRAGTISVLKSESGVGPHRVDILGGQSLAGLNFGSVDTIASPSFDPLPNLTLTRNSNEYTVELAGISIPGAAAIGVYRVSASSNNPALLPSPTVNYAYPSVTGSLQLKPNANQTGEAEITVTVSDGGPDGDLETSGDNHSFARTFLVSVVLPNQEPTLDPIPNSSIDEDAVQQLINLTGISDGGDGGQTLTLTAESHSPALIPHPTVQYTSAQTFGQLSFEPTPNLSGSSVIVVTIRDDGGTEQGGIDTSMRSFTVTVAPVNDAPTLDAISNLAIDEDAGQQTVALAGISAGGGESQPLQVTASSDTPGLIPNPTIEYTSPSATGSLKLTPAADQSGTAIVTVTVTDGGLDGDLSTDADNGTILQSFTVTVAPVNDAPTLDAISDLAIDEDAGQQTVALAGIAAGGGESQPLQVTASSDKPGLIPNPTIEYTSPNATGSLKLTPTADQSGTAIVTVTVTDGGLDGDLSTEADNGTTQRSFTVTVAPVNDAPTHHLPIPPHQGQESQWLEIAISPSTFTDVDTGDQLHYTAKLDDGSQLPDWLSFDDSTGTFSGIVPFDMDEEDNVLEIQVLATDPGGATADASFALTLTELPHPWKNPENSMDVLPGGGVIPVDVLTLINFINSQGMGMLSDPVGHPVAPIYVDVNGDGNPTAQDVLMVINYINSGAGTSAAAPAGEGESGQIYAAAVLEHPRDDSANWPVTENADVPTASLDLGAAPSAAWSADEDEWETVLDTLSQGPASGEIGTEHEIAQSFDSAIEELTENLVGW